MFGYRRTYKTMSLKSQWSYNFTPCTRMQRRDYDSIKKVVDAPSSLQGGKKAGVKRSRECQKLDI